jgi:hypothetical protein
MTEANVPEHPGKIVFVDGITQEVINERLASEVPFDIRFVETETGLVPVVKIVSFTTPERRIIRQYGPDDQLLQSTIQVAEGN